MASISRVMREQHVGYATAEHVDAASWKVRERVAEKTGRCPHCDNDADSYECGRDDRYGCFQDPTPAHRWKVTTPKDLP
ncbi:hypothetical protein [Arthrobacter sp. CP30]